MVGRSVFGAPNPDVGYGSAGNPELIVDKILNTSYDVVRYVAANMVEIRLLHDNVDMLKVIEPYVSDLQIVSSNMEDMLVLSANLLPIQTLAGRIDDINVIMANLADILNAAQTVENRANQVVQLHEDVVTIKNTLLSDIKTAVNPLAHNATPTASYNPVTKVITFGLPVVVATNINIGTVSQGTTAEASMSGTAPNLSLNLTIPNGKSAWNPVIANVVDGARIVQRVVDWVDGTGLKPPINMYLSPTGLTGDIAQATNIRGPVGSGSGDMNASTYDPSSKNADAFNMANMVESETNKILTATERTKLAGITAGATVNATDAQLRDRSTHTGTQSMTTIVGLETTFNAVETLIGTKEDAGNKGVANGYASLDENGKVPLAQMNESVLGAMSYQNVWNAANNTPQIPIASEENKGHYYVVAVNGNTNIDGNQDWAVGDWIVSNGTAWNKIDSTDQVTSVNGQRGAVQLTKSDVGLGNVPNLSAADMPLSNAATAALVLKASTATVDASLATLSASFASQFAAKADKAAVYSMFGSVFLTFADQLNQQQGFLGGVADAFDNQSGINLGESNGLDQYTIMLMHFDGTLGKQTLVEDNWRQVNEDLNLQHVWAVRGPSNGIYLDTAQSKFGGSSMRFPGGSGSYFHGNGPADFNFAAGQDFTYDFQLRLNALGISHTIFDCSVGGGSSSRCVFGVSTANILNFYFAGATRINGTTPLALDTWYHVSFQMKAGNLTISLNGVQEGPAWAWGMGTAWYQHSTVGTIWGADINGNTGLNGWIDELRVSKVARYSFPFVPPTAPYGAPTGTQTTKQIYDPTNGWYRPAALRRNIYQTVFETGVNMPARSSRINIKATKLDRNGAYVRFRLNLANIITVNAMYVGKRSTTGNNWDFAAAPTQVTFNGGSPSLTTVALEWYWTDWVLCNLEANEDLIIALDHTASVGGGVYLTLFTDPAMTVYYKAGVPNEASQIAPTGYTTASLGQTMFVDAIQVKDLNVPSAPMILQSQPVTATAVPTKVRLLLQTVGDPISPNVDLIGSVSRNNGTSYTTVTLALTTSLNGINQYEGTADVSLQSAGSQMVWRASTPTGKTVVISGSVEGWE